MNISIRNRMFFLICICIPFLFVPKVFQFTFIGGPIGTELVVLPIVVAYVYTICCLKKRYELVDSSYLVICQVLKTK